MSSFPTPLFRAVWTKCPVLHSRNLYAGKKSHVIVDSHEQSLQCAGIAQENFPLRGTPRLRGGAVSDRSSSRYSSRCRARYLLHRMAFAEGGFFYELALEDSEDDLTIFLPRLRKLTGGMRYTEAERIPSVDGPFSYKLELDDSEDDMRM